MLPLFVITKHSNREDYPVGDAAAEDLPPITKPL
jgi:hypothetical protein